MSGKKILLPALAGLLLAACQPVEKQAAPVADSARQDCMGPRQEIMCTMHYDPVCGCDGKTYSNSCMARAAGILKTEQGPCPDDPEPVRDDLR